jgi:RimJ/RimL family protein N-acetyltransferase
MDEWQGKGIGSVLVDELARRRPAGVTRVVTYVSSENHASFALLRRLGPATVIPDGRGSSKVVVELDPAA